MDRFQVRHSLGEPIAETLRRINSHSMPPSQIEVIITLPPTIQSSLPWPDPIPGEVFTAIANIILAYSIPPFPDASIIQQSSIISPGGETSGSGFIDTPPTSANTP